MTRITFQSRGGRLRGVVIRGHSGCGAAGTDIVCAAVTSAVRLTETTVRDVLGLPAAVRTRERDAFLSLRLPGGLEGAAAHTCQTLLTGMMVYFTQLRDEFPAYIDVREEALPSP